MNLSKLSIILSCLLAALACSAAKYQIKVLNTPSITIDNHEAKVGDWFTDESVIVWSRDNQAMRVVSDENKVYTLSAKLYKEAKAKKFSDFILYTKPLAARGTNDLDLIEQLAERFNNTFIMLDEIVIDLSDLPLPKNAYFMLCRAQEGALLESSEIIRTESSVIIRRNDLKINESTQDILQSFYVHLFKSLDLDPSLITDNCLIELLPIQL